MMYSVRLFNKHLSRDLYFKDWVSSYDGFDFNADVFGEADKLKNL